MKPNSRTSIALLTTAILAACGGGGGDDTITADEVAVLVPSSTDPMGRPIAQPAPSASAAQPVREAAPIRDAVQVKPSPASTPTKAAPQVAPPITDNPAMSPSVPVQGAAPSPGLQAGGTVSRGRVIDAMSLWIWAKGATQGNAYYDLFASQQQATARTPIVMPRPMEWGNSLHVGGGYSFFYGAGGIDRVWGAQLEFPSNPFLREGDDLELGKPAHSWQLADYFVTVVPHAIEGKPELLRLCLEANVPGFIEVVCVHSQEDSQSVGADYEQLTLHQRFAASWPAAGSFQ